MYKREDIRDQSDEEKGEVYAKIDALFHANSSVEIKEHGSGFPAITVDCEDIHILTDCLSLEAWYYAKREAAETAKVRGGE